MYPRSDGLQIPRKEAALSVHTTPGAERLVVGEYRIWARSTCEARPNRSPITHGTVCCRRSPSESIVCHRRMRGTVSNPTGYLRNAGAGEGAKSASRTQGGVHSTACVGHVKIHEHRTIIWCARGLSCPRLALTVLLAMIRVRRMCRCKTLLVEVALFAIATFFLYFYTFSS